MHVVSVRTERELPSDAVRWNDVVDPANAPAELPPAEIHPDDDMCIFYTSGTTGFPKGAQLTHRGSVHNVLHIAFSNAVSTAAAAAVAQATGDASAEAEAAADDVAPSLLAATPLFHVTANNCVLHGATAAGAKLTLMYKWDPARAIELIEREKVTGFTGVPTMSREMLAHPDWQTRDTSTMASMGGGGAALQPDLVEKIATAKDADVQPSTGYGLTETHGIVTAIGSIFFRAKPASAGRIMPTFDYKVIDDEGNEVPKGERGELCVKGPGRGQGLSQPARRDRRGDRRRLLPHRRRRVPRRGRLRLHRRPRQGHGPPGAARTSTAPRSKPRSTSIPTSPKPRCSASPTTASARPSAPPFASPTARPSTRTGSPSTSLRCLAKFKIPEHVWFLDEPLPQNANGKFLKRQLRGQLIGAD